MSRRRHRRRHYRRWPRRILVLVNVIVALCLISTGSVYAYVRHKIDSIRTIAAPHLAPIDHTSKDSSGGLSPENILLIGNETRSGLGTDIYGDPNVLTGSLSDVIMILHLDPAKQSASILSLPRDLFVPQPAGGEVGPYQKIDAALNDGAKGPDNLIQAIQDDFGIPINHFVELNFNGFQQTVNAIGGINVDFPEPVYDAMSGLNVPTTGCQHLNGTQALALVRARHLQYDPPGVSADDKYDWPYDPESDLSRIIRDHTFLRILTQTAMSKGLSNPIKANAFITGLINQITVDPGLRDQLVSLATHYRHLDPANAPETTLPVNQVGGSDGYSYSGTNVGDVEFSNQPLDNQVIQAWDAAALPTPAAPTAVQILDNTEEDEGSVIAAGLRVDGLPVTSIDQGDEPASTSPTWVDYAPGNVAAGLAVMNDLKGAVMLRADPDLTAGTVQVEVGTSATVSGPGASAGHSSDGSSGSGSSDSSSGSGSEEGDSGSSSGSGTTTTTTPSNPNAERSVGGSGELDPTPSSASDQQKPWDPLACPAN